MKKDPFAFVGSHLAIFVFFVLTLGFFMASVENEKMKIEFCADLKDSALSIQAKWNIKK